MKQTRNYFSGAACFNPKDCFLAFDKSKLVRLAKSYPNDFSLMELVMFQNQLATYAIDIDQRLSSYL